jgi:hypothetical protein
MARQELSTRFAVPNARYTAKTIPGKLAIQPTSFDFNYTTPAPFCKADKLEKGKCTVQLNFINGKPVLRLCNAKNQPGRTIPLTDATAARRIAKAACSSFDVNKVFPESFTDTSDEDIEYDDRVEVAGLSKRSQASHSTHERSERLWAAVARARTREEREEARAAAEAFDARLAGTGKPRMMTLSLAGTDAKMEAARRGSEARLIEQYGYVPKVGAPSNMLPPGLTARQRTAWVAKIRARDGAPTKARGTKLKWCVYTKTKSGARKLSCHKLKRTAQAAAKKRKGATVRKGK